MKKPVRSLLIVLIILIAAGTGAFFLLRKPKKLKYKTATVQKGDIVLQVSATGTVNPVNKVTVGSQVSGILDTVLVDFNDRVQAGQVLARIDPRNYNSALAQARANLTSAELAVAQNRRDYVNAESLAARGLASGDQLFSARTAYEQAQTKREQAQGNYDQAVTNLAYCTITAPMGGVVISRKVQSGQTVAASFSAPELFTIADLSQMQVEVSVDEADVGKLDTGLASSFSVDAYSERTFEGRLVQVRNEPITSSNVVTYVGIVRVDNPEYLLKPGMTANVKVTVSSARDVLTVPNGATNAKLGTTLGLSSAAGRSGGSSARATGGERRDGGGDRAAGRARGARGGARDSTAAQPAAAKPVTRTVYVYEKNVPTPREVVIGINDSYNTEIKSGLNEGETVITGIDQGKVNPFQQSTGRVPMGGFR